MDTEKKTIHGIHHTHWDLEWYFTDTESMILLIYSLDEVINALESGKIDYYTLDGQLSILDKYFEIMPNKKRIVKKLVKENKLIIGPWYTQVDEFLTSGESYVRNLELGMEQAEELGNVMKVGYMPDSFGQSKDLPKILNGFDLDTFIFWRGFYKSGAKRDFYWQSEDGSTVLASNIKNGYFEGRDLFEKEESVDSDELLQKNIKESASNHTLLPIGWDQRPVYKNLKRIIELINNEGNEDYQLIESTYEQYFEQLKSDKLDLPTYSGEFMYASVSKIHRSIYSSRYDFKQLNDYLERKTVNVLEPLMLIADKLGIPYKKNILDKIWKLITINQAHDSLGGCNSDKTNKNILARGTRAKEYLNATIDYLIRKITISTNGLKTNDILIVNTLNYKNEKIKELVVYSKQKSFTIKDSNEKNIVFDVIEQEKLNQADVTRFDVEIEEKDIYYRTKILVDYPLEPFSIAVLHLENEQISDHNAHKFVSDTYKIENEYYHIEFDGKKVNLLLKSNQKTIKDFVQFVDDGDEGDSYDYSPAYDDQTVSLSLEGSKIDIQKGLLHQTLEFTGVWILPLDLSERATGNYTTQIPYRIKIYLNKNHQEIKFEINIDNTVKDHRIRSIIKSNIASNTSNAGTQFGYTVRDNEDKYLDKWKDLNWREEPTSLYPLLNYVNINDENESFSLLTQGPKEYQILENNENSIALTLFRSVGYLGRPDLIRRPGHASGIRTKYIETPDAQLLQKLSFEFSVIYEEEFDSSEVYKEYYLYSTELPYYQLQDMESLSSTMSYFMINEHDNLSHFEDVVINLPSMENSKLVVSSIRKKDSGIQVRLFNPYLENKLTEEKLQFEDSQDYQIVNLRGEVLSDRMHSKEIIFDEIQPGEIITVKIFD